MKKYFLILIALVAFAMTGCAQVDQSERGVVKEFGKITDVFEPGLTFYNCFTKDVDYFSVKTELQTTTANAASKDQQDINVTVAVNYRLDETKIREISTKYGSFENAVNKGLKPQISGAITSIIPEYTPEEMLHKRQEAQTKIKSLLETKLDSISSNIIVEDLVITDFSFSAEYKKSIEEKQIAQQVAKKEEYETQRQIEINKQATNKAKADSTVIAVQMAALKTQGGKDYLMLKYLEKWDGHLPQVSGSANTLVMPELK